MQWAWHPPAQPLIFLKAKDTIFHRSMDRWQQQRRVPWGGLCYMLAQYGTMSLKEVLDPAMQLAAGYPIDAQTANSMERGKKLISEWPYSKKVFLPHTGEKREAP